MRLTKKEQEICNEYRPFCGNCPLNIDPVRCKCYATIDGRTKEAKTLERYGSLGVLEIPIRTESVTEEPAPVKDTTVINVLGTDYEVIKDNNYPKMKDSNGICEWISKRIIYTDDYVNDDDALENIEDYIHKVLRHEAFHAYFAELGMTKWLVDEDLVDMLAINYPKIRRIMDACDAIDVMEEG